MLITQFTKIRPSVSFRVLGHIWVPQLVYFDKIHHFILKKNKFSFPYSHFSQMGKATHFVVLGAHSMKNYTFLKNVIGKKVN
jgi:hypothetical protein